MSLANWSALDLIVYSWATVAMVLVWLVLFWKTYPRKYPLKPGMFTVYMADGRLAEEYKLYADEFHKDPIEKWVLGGRSYRVKKFKANPDLRAVAIVVGSACN